MVGESGIFCYICGLAPEFETAELVHFAGKGAASGQEEESREVSQGLSGDGGAPDEELREHRGAIQGAGCASGPAL